jgi:[acyl-carrier-protein] S-malonyltransferase
MSRIAFIFPGQGSQAVGMGKELADAFPAARAVFDEVDAALGESLSKLMWEGPIDTLTLTANAQPALMAVSLAAARALETGFGVKISQAAFVAGHSLGEYSALAAAGALSVTDAAKLLRRRGEAMQAATDDDRLIRLLRLRRAPEEGRVVKRVLVGIEFHQVSPA